MGGWPGVCGKASSMVISDISTNSSSRILLATLGGRTAAGVYGPREVSPAAGGTRPRMGAGGGSPREGWEEAKAAAASRSSPACCEPATEAGVKIGTDLGREIPAADIVPGRGQQEEGGE